MNGDKMTVRQDDSDRGFCERLIIQENCAYSGESRGGFDKVKPLYRR